VSAEEAGFDRWRFALSGWRVQAGDDQAGFLRFWQDELRGCAGDPFLGLRLTGHASGV